MASLRFLLPLLCAVTLTLPACAAPEGAKPAHAAKSKAKKAQSGVPYADREDALRFADEVAARDGLPLEWVRSMVGQAQKLPVVARLMEPAPTGTPKNWRVYRSRFIDPVRLGAGVRFWQENREALERAEQQFGVPAEIIVGIVGVETIYGQQMGDFRVLDSLATLAFDFPPNHPRAAERAKYFRGELEAFLTYCNSMRIDPRKPRGSYAGAMGMPQFMPSSLVRWGVDYDGDKRIDLAGSADDVIGSVANYFKGYGWNPGMPTYYPVSFDAAKLDLDALLAPDILPTFSVASMQAKGVVLEGAALEHKGPLALIELQNGGDPPTYVAGTENFYVITRYNWSSYYAMAVIELGREVKEAMPRQGRQSP
ncbi:lytic murein transglycosylase B [Ramlibacter sp. G-1-2-2]|uniref:Lytic murein transglycosylase B n=1 Tax=Ramlibacter agri TaxID=2728837 RepID=A0A848HFC2_9BURK|nr:lytic murein transglycosylase B [Ramlibacter agri]NML46308.1 lytic murein transglycosylase B [Ramlibacter agri]